MAARILLMMVAASCAAAENSHLHFDQDIPSTRGSDFMVAFMPNKKVPVDPRPQYQLLINTAEPEIVHFTVTLNENLPAEMREGFPHSGNVSYGEVYKVDLPTGIPVKRSVPRNLERYKAIRVQTKEGKKITVQGFNDDVRTSDGFIAISCDAMHLDNFVRYEHFVLSADSATEHASMFLIIPCDDDTRITVHPSQRITVTSLIDLNPGYNPVTEISKFHQVEPPNAVMFTANAAQTMLINHGDDLSGTIVRANKPLVVFSGHQCGQIPYNTTACDHMVEQIPPSMVYGQRFFLPPLGGRVSGDMFRVGTLIDQTQVNVTCVNASAKHTPTSLMLENNGLINRGEYLSFMTPGNFENREDYKPSYCTLESTEGVVVAQYSTGYSYDEELVGKRARSDGAAEIGDPFMSLIPPVHQYMNNYTVKSVKGAFYDFPTRFVNLAIDSKFFDNTPLDQSKIKINGTTAQPASGYIPFYCSDSNICGYGAEVEVTGGTTTIYHEQPDVGLFASYYSYQQQNSNAFPLGFELEPLAATEARNPNFFCVREDIGTLNISITRHGNLRVQSRFSMYTQSAEAEGNADYQSIESESFRYRGQLQERIMFAHIDIIDDDEEESEESFKIVFTPTQNIVFTNDTITVVICDNDGDPSSCLCTPTNDTSKEVDIWFEPSSYTVNEGDGTVTIFIRTNATAGIAEGAVHFNTKDSEVTVITTDSGIILSPATDGTDYSSKSANVTFENGAYTTSVVVPIIDDSTIEPQEFFYGTLEAVQGINVLIDQAEIHIIDNDDQEVYLHQEKYIVSEVAGKLEVCVNRKEAIPTPLTIELSTMELAPLEAKAGQDYNPNRLNVTFEANEVRKCFFVDINNDDIIEENERFLVAITSVPSGVRIGRPNATVCILDDDAIVYFEYESYEVDEDDGIVTVCVLREGQVSEALIIQIMTNDITPPQALANEDYVPLTGAELLFQPYELRACFDVTIVSDEITENAESFTAVISAVPPAVTIGDPDTTIITIGPETCDNVCSRVEELEEKVEWLTAIVTAQLLDTSK